MGKSPAKWIKSVFSKKSSKSSLTKGKDKLVKRSANAEDTLISANIPACDLRSVPPPLTSNPLPEVCDGNGVDSNLSSDDRVAFTPGKQHGNVQITTHTGLPIGLDKSKLEQAVTKVQAATRGYLARRAFGALKGIITLQALIRGHLVRRQAVATFCCVMGIVKFQASVRSRIATRAEDQNLRIMLEAKSSSSLEILKYGHVYNLWKQVFLRKLLTSSPKAMPLLLQYGSDEPNSAWEWVERWTQSRFWIPSTHKKNNFNSKSQVKSGSAKAREASQGRPKRGVDRLQNGSSHTNSDSEKNKQSLKKGSIYSTESSMDHPQSEIAKVKRNLKKISSSTMDTSLRPVTDTEKPKRSQKKASISTTETGITDSGVESTEKDIAMTKPSTVDSGVESTEKVIAPVESKFVDAENIDISEESALRPVASELTDSLHDDLTANLQPTMNMNNGKSEDIHRKANGLHHLDDLISEENQATNRRRASLTAKQDDEENGLHITPRVPSYMAATESAKAKLRMQGSPMFGDDSAEKNGFTRRHSLPSLTNGKLISLSPRVQKLVQSGGKVGIRSDKSLTSSRDASDKALQPGWRR